MSSNITPIRMLKTPDATPIAERAMLVDLDLSTWSAHRTDEKVSREVAESHNTDRDAGNYRKRLVDKDAMSKIRAAMREAYWYHMNHTLPWLDNGARVISADAYLDYMQRMRELQQDVEAAVKEFVEDYPNLIAAAQRKLNGLFDASDYPPPSEIAHRFGIKYTIMPLPQGSDFRVTNLDGGEVARLQAEIDRTVDAAIREAMRKPYERVLSTVGKMVEALRAYHVDDQGKTHHVFRDSLVGNVRELVDVLPDLNITSDPTLTALTNRMRSELTVYDGDTLRSSLAARQQVAESAAAILAAVSEYRAAA